LKRRPRSLAGENRGALADGFRTQWRRRQEKSAQHRGAGVAERLVAE
jgi:hypothetical protein